MSADVLHVREPQAQQCLCNPDQQPVHLIGAEKIKSSWQFLNNGYIRDKRGGGSHVHEHIVGREQGTDGDMDTEGGGRKTAGQEQTAPNSNWVRMGGSSDFTSRSLGREIRGNCWILPGCHRGVGGRAKRIIWRFFFFF